MTTAARGGEHPYPIRPVSAEELDAFYTVTMHAFQGSPMTPEERQLALSHLEFDRSLAAFAAATPVGTAASYSFQLTGPGFQSLPAAGITGDSVLPSYKLQGDVLSLMRRQ